MAKKQETVNGEVIDIKKWANPKIKVRRVYKIEEDGSKTKAHVIERSGIAKFHSEDGPALVNYDDLSLTRFPNVHFVGDALSARGITVSGAQGTLVAEQLLKN